MMRPRWLGSTIVLVVFLTALASLAGGPSLEHGAGAQGYGSAEGLPPPAEDLRFLVRAFCDSTLDGRVVGSPGLDKVAEMIVASFEHAGLKPAGDNGDWFQHFKPAGPKIVDAVRLPEGAVWGEMTLRNVVGMIPGTGPGCVIIGAHYDHLGRDENGAVYPGADDNASGVAALCSMARNLASQPPQMRTILFVAFSGEEEGLLGSQWFVEHPPLPLESAIAMINLDTIGRSSKRQLIIFSASSARELPSILRGANMEIFLELSIPEKATFGSDHVSFLAKGVPSIHLFTGANADYHRITDTPDQLNYVGLFQISAFATEVVRFLANREEPLTFVPQAAERAESGAAPSQPVTARRVSLGTIPDMAFDGDGVLLRGTMTGSPAEAAGLQKGDRIVGIDEETISGLEDYSAVLKSHKPGDVIRVRYVRDDKERTVEATLVERK